MIKWIETTGRSEEDAIAAALFQLGLERDDVSVEVIERAKSGFLGFGSNPAKVRVSYEEENGVPKAKTRDEFKIDVFAKEEPKKPAEKPAPKAAPTPAAPVEKKTEAPAEKPVEKAEAAPAAPVVEETILAAKPGWQPPKKNQPRPERREQPRKARAAQLQEGDEVLIGGSQRPAAKEVTLTPAPADDEKAQKISQFLAGLMEHLDVQATPEIFVTDEGGYKVILQGKGLGAIIGRRGETLDAIQQLTNYSVNHGQSKRVRIHVDAEGYRAKREESLQRLAVKVAGKVVKYRKNMTLEPMNAYERHVIHTSLQDYPNVTTYSTGVEPNRRTVVAYAPGQK
ncbi:RNA-binding cell elongation regulator Jag/EloR [Pseudoflavonifractor phocaeensis]|uniref:RNA-binding cell elongation regulator Jag/EloR n=1 Tax=Pseudoflavonifractor phocaeensis TaxID=1870988 RepID=UPI001F165CF0|nr:RNA-binding cell elongation regulator Jag/EloR [Pseudoflavonifractor phocaeensis]MCF2662491.1 Jag N-terminal domain-containing protein [Pseudoflavonifractor phocaeensis]